jgi:hypothetical protein
MCAYALGPRGGESDAHKLDHLLDRKAMGEHHRLGAAVAAGGEQSERAAAVGLWGGGEVAAFGGWALGPGGKTTRFPHWVAWPGSQTGRWKRVIITPLHE